MNFSTFNLHPHLLANIDALGYTTPTPIQSQTIPSTLQGKDVMGLAQTGTGKTAAFAVPILQRLLVTSSKGVKSLIVAPTRELTQQIHDSIFELCKGTQIRCAALYGGVNMKSQLKVLNQGIDIIVACPGRLLDHLNQKTILLDKVEILVLDEADQMFDMGFLPDIRKILRHLPKKRQTLLFSATMPGAIQGLAHDILHNPVTVKIDHSKPTTSVKQTLFPIAKHLKTELLIHILQSTKIQSVIVFTRTKHTAKKVALRLANAGFRATSLQGNLSQNKRQSAMNGFRDGSLQILVATDIASRGIDVNSISHVINFDIPPTVETYIHRIGRTGRASNLGEAFTLITSDNTAEVKNIEKVLKYTLEQRKLDNFDYSKAAPVVTGSTHKPRMKPQQRKHHHIKQKN